MQVTYPVPRYVGALYGGHPSGVPVAEAAYVYCIPPVDVGALKQPE
jgi:hypothetical protein